MGGLGFLLKQSLASGPFQSCNDCVQITAIFACCKFRTAFSKYRETLIFLRGTKCALDCAFLHLKIGLKMQFDSLGFSSSKAGAQMKVTFEQIETPSFHVNKKLLEIV